MARKEVNIGTTGNDATGDSIRVGFDKVNNNFVEIYAALGLGGGLNFQNLDNTPSAITANKILATNTTGDAIVEKLLEGEGLTIDNATDPTKIIIRNTGTEVVRDTSPELGGNLDANNFLIENLGTPTKTGDAATKDYIDNNFLAGGGDTATGQILLRNGSNPRVPTLADEAVNKKYTDSKVALAGDTMTGPLLLSETPSFADPSLQAATKGYVDKNSFTSTNNIFVSKSGRTEAQMKAAGADENQIGRAQSYAFNSVREACFYAERIVKGDIVLKDQGLFTGDVYWKVPSKKPGPYTVNLAADGTEDLTNVLANKLLVDNRRFIQEETLAFIENEINDGDNADDFADTFTFNRDKCFRDLGLIIDAVSFDLTYVGNSKTVDAALSYWDGATSRVAGQQSETVAAINFAKSLITTNVLTNTAYVAPSNTRNPYANDLITQNLDYVAEETIAYINDQITNNVGIWTGFTYNEAKCRRDTKLILQGVAFDLKFGGNTKSRDNAQNYWDGATSQVAGQQAQTVDALDFAKDLVRNFVLQNLTYTSSKQSTYVQYTSSNNGEGAASTKVNNLMNSIATVINSGLGSLPAFEGTFSNQSGYAQFVDAAIIAEAGASTTIGTLMDIITNVVTNGTGVAPTKTGGEGRETNIPLPEITIFVESGLYEEYFPIVLPENVSLKGDEFRRTIIQPLVGVRPPSRAINLTYEKGDLLRYNGTALPKESRFRKHYDSQYSRADTFSGSVNQIGSNQITIKDVSYAPVNGLYFVNGGVTYYVKDWASDPDAVGDTSRWRGNIYSDINTTTATTLGATINNNTVIELKKLNQHMDLFLMNNATILRNLSLRRHQGFINVLDPEGQILTKSPYVQTVSSFSGQGGGGQYVDGNAGVQYGTVVDNPASGSTITLQGLTRAMELPTTFLYQDSRNFVSGVSDFEKFTHRVVGATAPIDDGLSAGTFKQTLTLASTTTIISRTSSNSTGNIPQNTEIRLETAGNKSMTCNDYTQINSDGFGLIATNAGLIEAVSVFTYYCDTSYWARNGGQIRSLNGSSCYGRVGLKAEGSDPNENLQSGLTFFRHVNAQATGSPDPDYTQIVKADTVGGTVNKSGNTEIKIKDFDYLPFEDSRIELTAYSTNSDTTEYVVNEITGARFEIASINVGSATKITTSSAHGFRHGSVVVIEGLDGNGFSTIDGAYYIDVTSGNGTTEFFMYTNSSLSTGFNATSVVDGSYNGSGADAIFGGKATLSLGSALNIGTGTQVPNDANITLTIGKKVLLTGITDAPRVLPSSALKFAGAGIDAQVFRILNVERFDVQEPTGTVSNVQEHLLDLRVPPNLSSGTTSIVTTRISTMRATGHDFLNIGWGNYIDSNYPNNVYGSPAGKPDFSADQANEAVEVGSGRTFYASTDQDGNFRVGQFFRVNQGDGSVELNANIGLTNVDSLKFTKGTSIDEFSTDRKMQGQSDDAVPTESTLVKYLNSSIIGQHEDGSDFPEPSTTGSQAAGGTFGLLNRAGYNGTNLAWNRMNGVLNLNANKITNIFQGTNNTDAINKLYADSVFKGDFTDSVRTDVTAFIMLNDSTVDSGSIDMNGNRIKSLRDPVDGSDAVTKQYVDTQNSIGGLEGTTITGNPANTDLLMFTGTNTVDGLGNPIVGMVNTALNTTTDAVSGSRTFGEPTGTGSDIRFIRAGNSIQVGLATGSIKDPDVSEIAGIQQSKLSMELASTRASANAGGKAISGINLSNPIRITTSSTHDLVNGDLIGINDIAGTIELNTNFYYISKVDNTNFTIYTDQALTGTVNGTVGFTPYISGGFVTNSRMLQQSSGLAAFDNAQFTIDTGWVTLKTSTGLTDGVPLSKIVHQAASSILGVPAGGGAAAAVNPLTPAQVRTIANVEDGADVTDYANVKTAGAIMKDGTVSMNDATTLRVVNLEPKVDNTTDLGSSTKYWNDIYGTTLHADIVKKKTLGTNFQIQNSTGATALSVAEVVANSTFAGSAAKLTTARAISVSGAVTGTVNFDGSGAADISTSVNHNHDSDYVDIDGDTMTGTLIGRAIRPSANNTYDLGTTGNKYANVYATLFQGTATSARFADLAENYLGDNTYEPGTVIMFGGVNEVTLANEMMTTKVAGVVSTNPAHLMNADLEGDFVVTVALTGRVPCKVVGNITKGDMIVTSDVPGVGVAIDNPKLGSVIGKALQDYNSTDIGTIEVVVGKL
tara:strand:- start:9691 stop:16278 length:6588 start_codon:yes stop_codon:yes gene_type:complete